MAGEWHKSYLHSSQQRVEIKLANSNIKLILENYIFTDWGITKHGISHGSAAWSLISSCIQKLHE
jgi:hypothetical protein